MSIGLIMFLLMLTFAVQILFNLYATSVVSGLAIEAARDAAEFDPAVPSGPTDARLSEVEEQFESRVGPGASIDLRVDGDEVLADVRFVSNTVFPAVFDAQPFGVIDRTFAVRIEQQQPFGP